MQIFPRRIGSFDLDKFFYDMKIKSSLALFSVVGIVGIAFLFHQYSPFHQGGPKDRDAALIHTITQVLSRGHFQPKEFVLKFIDAMAAQGFWIALVVGLTIAAIGLVWLLDRLSLEWQRRAPLAL